MKIKNLIQKLTGGAALLAALAGMTTGTQAANFSAGNLAVLVAAGSGSNTNCWVVEINTNTAGQTATQTIAIDGSTNRVSGSATSTMYASDSDDGTLFCFTVLNTNNTTANANTLNPRGVVTLNSSGTYALRTTYTGSSGNQTRAATTVNNAFWYAGDQGGFYTNGTTAAVTSGNLRSVKPFGGTVYSFTASAGVAPVSTLSASGIITALPGLATGGTTNQDFYLISSGANGSTYDVLYVLSASSATAGTIAKFSLVSGNWTANGTYTTTFGGFGLCAVKSGTGTALFVTTGTGATINNSVIRLNDTAGYNSTIAITTGNNVTLYTATAGAILKGLAFAPLAPPTYTITYNGNGSTGGTAPVDGSSPYISGSTVTVLGQGSLVKSGYTFAGWNTAANGSGTAYGPSATFSIVANTTLYAQWTALPTYTVTYNGNGNDGGTVPTDANTYISGSTVTVLGNTGGLTRTGYAFAGWNTAANGSGTAYAPSATFSIAANTTLYAQWTPTYTVTYDGNGNDSGNPPTDANSPYTNGATVTVLGNTGGLVKSGYTFSGWNTAANGSGTAYAPSATFSIAANTTLYAQWAAAATYTVIYNSNGSDGGTAPVDGSSPYTSGSSVTVLGNTGGLTKAGYFLSGWNTAANGSGTSYSFGTAFNITSNTTLYAKWSVPGATKLAITEVMTSASGTNPDWWELSNLGTNDVDLSGYSWRDDSAPGFFGATNIPFNGVIIHTNESIIFCETKGSINTAADFRTWWGLSSRVQVIIIGANPGLGASGDSVRLWSTNIAALGSNTNGFDLNNAPEYFVDRVDTSAATQGFSQYYNTNNGRFDLSSAVGVNGAFQAATTADVGSPGIALSLPAPVVIAQQPADATVALGAPATFTVTSRGLPKPTFQWLFNGLPVDTNRVQISFTVTTNYSVSTLTITNAQLTNGGTYRAVANNGFQSVTSSNAVLTINTAPLAPFFTLKPATSLTAFVGQTVTFRADAFGSPTPAFYWQFNSNTISGQTDPVYTLSLSDTNQSGLYTITATNSVGATNTSILLTVTPKPNLRITEVCTAEATNALGSTEGHNDWWELSNFGNFAVNLKGYRFDDNSQLLSAAYTITNDVIIAPGESIIFAEGMTPDTFRAWWGPQNLRPGLQIISYQGSALSFSATAGDSLELWNEAATTETDPVGLLDAVSVSVNNTTLTFSIDPVTRFWWGNPEQGLSTLGVNGAFASAFTNGTTVEIGSPGTVINVPVITSVTKTNGGFNLVWFTQPNWTNSIQYKNNLTDPTWLNLGTVISGNSAAANYFDSTAAAQRFYRINLNP